MSTPKMSVLALLVLVLAACGGGTDPAGTQATTAPHPGTEDPTNGGSTTTDASQVTTPEPGGDTVIRATIDGVEHNFRPQEPEGCLPGAGRSIPFRVGGVAVDTDGDDLDPMVSLNFSLYTGFTNETGSFSGLNLRFDHGNGGYNTIPDPLTLESDGLPPAEEWLGSWTLDGNRASGEVILFGYQGRPDRSTVDFEFICGG